MNYLFLLPYPPPLAGPELIAKELIESDFIKNRNDVIIVKSNIQVFNKYKGKINVGVIIRLIKVYCKFIFYLFRTNCVFLSLNSNKTGFLRDSVFIITCWILNKKCIAQYHGSHFSYFFYDQNIFFRHFIKRVLSRIDTVIVFSETLKDMFNKIYEGKLEILYNGLNLNNYKYKKIKNHDNRPFTILFLGHLTYSKGFYDLIFAFKMLYKKYGGDVSLIFAGENYRDDPRMDLLSEKWRNKFLINGSKKAGVCSDFIINCKEYNSIYPGIVSGEKKSKLFYKSDIFVLPSYSEGLSMGCLEAMAFGLPVITTPVGAMPDVIKNGENGFITPISDHKKLFENIEQLMNQKELRIKMGNNNIQAVKEKYDIENIAERLLNILPS